MDVAHEVVPLSSCDTAPPPPPPHRDDPLAALGPVLAICRDRAHCAGDVIARMLARASRMSPPIAAIHLDARGVVEALHWPRDADAPVLVRLPDTDVLAWDALGGRAPVAPTAWPHTARVPALVPGVARIARHVVARASGFATPIRCGAGPRAALVAHPVARMSVLAWHTLEALRALGDYELVLAAP